MSKRSHYGAQKRRRQLDKLEKREVKKRRKTEEKSSEDEQALIREYLGLPPLEEETDDESPEEGDGSDESEKSDELPE